MKQPVRVLGVARSEAPNTPSWLIKKAFRLVIHSAGANAIDHNPILPVLNDFLKVMERSGRPKE